MNGKQKAVVLMIAMFGLGVISGIALQTYRFHRMPFPHNMFTEKRIKRLSAQLDLSPAQEQAVREIFQKAHDQAVQVNEEVSWDLEDIHRDSVQAIRKVLTPEQIVKFEVLHQKFHARHKNIVDEESEESTAPVHSSRS